MRKLASSLRWFAVAAVLCMAGTASAEPSAQVTAEIEYLLAFVQQSECVFVRNGDDHGPADAAAHIRKKYQHFKKKINTTEDFIKRAATGSLMSGKPYLVRCPPQDTLVATADWMQAALAAHRSGNSN